MGRILDWIFQDTDEDLYSQYKTDVLDCHPFKSPLPITFEQYKNMNSIENVDEKIVSRISEPLIENPTTSYEEIISD